MTKWKIFKEVVKRTLRYYIVELILIILFGVGLWQGHIWSPLLIVGFVLTALWILVASMKESEVELEFGLAEETVFITDFIAGTILFTVLAVMVSGEAYWYWIMYALAAVQNLRYTVRSWNLLRAARCKM